MTISIINNAQNTQDIWQSMLQMKQQIDSVMKDAVSQANGDNGNPLGVSFEFSKPSELLSKLAQLQQSDPEKFKSLMNEIADKLQKAADEGGDSGFGAKMLGDLAAKFKNAAETGDLSQLQPQKMPKGGGAPPQGAPPAGGAEGASGSTGSAASTSSTSETTNCTVCGAEISSDSTVCSECGALVEDEESTENSGTDKAKIAQYLLNATKHEQNSLLDILSQLVKENDTSGTSGSDSNDTFSSIRNLLTKAFQELTQNKTT